jgi:iron complex outermembrane recepter protein
MARQLFRTYPEIPCAPGVVACVLLVLGVITTVGQGADDTAPRGGTVELEAGGPVDASDLDSLLEAAEQDLGQLTKVSVTAPALQMEVSTVSRQASTVGKSPAAVFVITNEMIHRSGARCIPEVLRMAPGVQVARLDASKWAVTIRGFNGRFANKLLVQIDGRGVYSPLFAGVFWDVQDVVLEDVERIEVVRGPGASVWGANAVNGIINIITKKAADTRGVLVQGGAGTEERGFATTRYGGRLGENAHYRVYGKWFERDRAYMAGDVAQDDWRMGRGGFRLDWEPDECDTFTFQGDYDDGKTGRRNIYPSPDPPTYMATVDDDAHIAGGNGLVRWTRRIDDDTDWSVQAYYDRTERHWISGGFEEDRDTVDLDFQYRFALGERHSVVCGASYRNSRGHFRGISGVLSMPDDTRADDLFSYFIQDQITLQEDLLFFTVGSKFEHNDYTGFEGQPTIRLLWTPSKRQSIWASVSRAVRTPSWIDHDVSITMPLLPGPPPISRVLLGNPALQSESLIAYEAGIRVQSTDAFSWDLAFFFNDYDEIRDLHRLPLDMSGIPFVAPLSFENCSEEQSIGFEIASTYQATPCWRLQGAYSLLAILDGNEADGADGADGGDARNVAFLQSSWDLGHDVQFDVMWRWMDSLHGMISVPAYNAMDVRLAWLPRSNLELAVVGRNLLDDHHPEFADPYLNNVSTEVQSEVYGMATYRY